MTEKKEQNDLQNLLKQVETLANNALYFDDSSDYGIALWRILHTVSPDMFDEDNKLKNKLKYIE